MHKSHCFVVLFCFLLFSCCCCFCCFVYKTILWCDYSTCFSPWCHLRGLIDICTSAWQALKDFNLWPFTSDSTSCEAADASIGWPALVPWPGDIFGLIRETLKRPSSHLFSIFSRLTHPCYSRRQIDSWHLQGNRLLWLRQIRLFVGKGVFQSPPLPTSPPHPQFS